MIQAIKAGNIRIVLNNVTEVRSEISETLVQRDDGSWFVADRDFRVEDHKTGKVVTVYFASMNDDGPDYCKLYAADAEEFLRKFDELTGVIV